MSNVQKQALTPTEAAQYLNVSKATLQRLRDKGIGIPYIKLANGKGKNCKVLYSLKDLDKFLSKTQKTS
jgi:excisionase family DNA binding protein